MSKQKPSSNKEIVNASASDEKTSSQSTESVENTTPETNKPDSKTEKQDQVQVKTEKKLEVKPEVKPDADKKPQKTPRTPRGFPWFGVFNLLLIAGIVAAAGYYWQMQQKTELQKNNTITALQQQLANKADAAQLQQRLAPLKSGIDNSVSQIAELQLQQQALEDATVSYTNSMAVTKAAGNSPRSST